VDEKTTWAEMRTLQRQVGEQLNPMNKVAKGIHQGELKAIYGAISNDLQNSLKFAPKAHLAWTKGMDTHKIKMGMLKNYLNKFNDPKNTDRFAAEIFKNARQGTTSINAYRTAIQSTDKKLYRRAVGKFIYSLGRNQGDELFNSTKFYRAYSNIPAKSRKAIFAGDKKLIQYGKDIEIVHKVAQQLAKGSGVLATEGSAGIKGAITYLLLGVGAIGGGAAAWGGTGAGVILGGLLGYSALMAKMVASPKVMNWLATAAVMKTPRALDKHVAKLAALYAPGDEELIDYIQAVIDKYRNAQ
jgi:hypothetical protein